MPNDKWQEQAEMQNGEVTTFLAMALNCEPEEVRGWMIIAHVHPKCDSEHYARMATNVPPEVVPHLILEGLGTL